MRPERFALLKARIEPEREAILAKIEKDIEEGRLIDRDAIRRRRERSFGEALERVSHYRPIEQRGKS